MTSTADDIRDNTNAQIDNFDPNTLTIDENTASPKDNTLTIDEEILKLEDKKQKREATPEELAKLENLKATKKSANLKLTKDDPDSSNDSGKGEFEIKEGDIIDYLFKEILLKYTNKTGQFVTGKIGHYTYKTLTIPNEIYKLYKEEKGTTSSKKETGDEDKFLKDLDKTTDYYTEKLNLGVDVDKYSDKLFDNMQNNDFKSIKEQKLLPEASIKGLEDLYKNDPQSYKRVMESDFKDVFKNVVKIEQSYQSFAHTYAQTMMLSEKNNNKDYKPENIGEDYNAYVLAGKRVFLEAVTINRENPQDNGEKTINNLFTDIREAQKQELDCIKDPKKEAKPNPLLDKINDVLRPDAEEETERCISTAPRDDETIDVLSHKLYQLKAEEALLTTDLGKNNTARKRLANIKNKNKDNTNGNTNNTANPYTQILNANSRD